MSTRINGSTVGQQSFTDSIADTITDDLAVGNITISTTKKLSGASELTFNAAASQPITTQQNGIEKIRVAVSGGFCVGTTVDCATGRVLLPNSGAYCLLDAGGILRTALYPASNDLNVGSTAWATLFLQSGSGGATALMCGGNTVAWAAANQFTHFRGAKITRTAVADTNYTVLITDQIVAVTSLSAPRTITLPSAATVGAGAVFTVKDESGNAATHNITVSHATQTIDGAASKTISVNYGLLNLYSNGTNWFTR